jgi:hypothetical protein
MSAGTSVAAVEDRGPSPAVRIAAVAVVLALAALAAYTVFSGPTEVPAPSSGAGRAAPGKAAPAGQEPSEGRESGRGE